MRIRIDWIWINILKDPVLGYNHREGTLFPKSEVKPYRSTALPTYVRLEQVSWKVCFVRISANFSNLPKVSIESIFRTFFILGGPRGTRQEKLQNLDSLLEAESRGPLILVI